MHEKQKMMAMIRKYDFALYELQLYLDTHPHSQEALHLWKNYQALRKKAVSAYVHQFGPIQPIQAGEKNTWNWVKGPWPWEKEAN